jgi:ABC-type glycerol-3-phosphate transport system substrate-binding protein
MAELTTRRGMLGGAALAGAAALAACGVNQESGGAPGGKAGSPATIRVMHRGSNQAQLDELEAAVKLFNEKFAAKKWTAVAEYHNSQSGSYDEKLISLLVGGTLPDSFYMNGENLPILA